MTTLKKTVKCKINPTKEQAQALRETLNAFAEACNAALRMAKDTGKTRVYDLHHACYYTLKARFGLTANYVCRALARVCASFGKKRPPTFFAPTSLDLDKDLIRYNPYTEEISIATNHGRQKIPVQIGNYQRHLLSGQHPKAGTLVYHRRTRTFFVHLVIALPCPPPTGRTPLGVDLGINRLLTTSDGDITSGREINKIRERMERTVASVQRKGTRGAKRLLRTRLYNKRTRFQRDTNHLLSKRLIAKAHVHGAFLVLEDLTGIHNRTVNKHLRKRLGRWAFAQLRQFVSYKAQAAGVAVYFVSPTYTSQTCSACGLLGKRHKHRFSCSCGYRADSDVNAARNIVALGLPLSISPEVAALSPATSSVL